MAAWQIKPHLFPLSAIRPLAIYRDTEIKDWIFFPSFHFFSTTNGLSLLAAASEPHQHQRTRNEHKAKAEEFYAPCREFTCLQDTQKVEREGSCVSRAPHRGDLSSHPSPPPHSPKFAFLTFMLCHFKLGKQTRQDREGHGKLNLSHG